MLAIAAAGAAVAALHALHRLQPVAQATVVAETRRQVGPSQGPTTFLVVIYLFPFKEVTDAMLMAQAYLDLHSVLIQVSIPSKEPKKLQRT